MSGAPDFSKLFGGRLVRSLDFFVTLFYHNFYYTKYSKMSKIDSKSNKRKGT
jgi:hypothetical protein